MTRRKLQVVVGTAAIVFSALYVVSDVMELAAGRLYTGQLIVTYLAEAAIPFFVLGLHAVQQREGGWLSLVGAVLYGLAFVGFSATVLYRWSPGTGTPMTSSTSSPRSTCLRAFWPAPALPKTCRPLAPQFEALPLWAWAPVA